jgi:two-component system NtrC family sensor kinase
MSKPDENTSPKPENKAGRAADNGSMLRLPPDVGAQLFHAIHDPALVVTTNGKIVQVNQALLHGTGKALSDVIGKGVCEIIHGGRWPHIECPLEQFLQTWSYRVEDTRLPGLGGGQFSLSIFPVENGNVKDRLILLMCRKLSQDEVRRVDGIRTAQLAAIGELAAGVAHEINNPINGIINYAQLLLDDSAADSEQALLLRKIVNEGERIATITYNLLSFARENENDRAIVDLNAVITDCMSLVQHQLENERINISFDLCEPSALVFGSHMQLMQVVLNIISNSRYALKERYGRDSAEKKISFSSSGVEIEGKKYFRLVITDYGTGIPQGILEKLFEPFFTTKPASLGTGLGLSISYGIVKNHSGMLRVNSMLNKFTEMIIEIPAAE